MRHAKSDWGEPGLKDFDRPLSSRGIKDAPEMGRYLLKIGQVPERIVSSPANRARQTTEAVMEASGMDRAQVLWNEDLYHGGVRDYLAAITATANDVSRIMLIGHNPLMEQTATVLAGSEHSVIVRMRTATIICIELMATNWEQVQPAVGQISWMMTPKVLPKD